MTFIELAKEILATSDTPLSSTEIWELAIKQNLDQKLNSTGKTPWATLAARLYVSVRDNPKSEFKIVSIRPKRFYLTSKENNQDFEKYIEPVTREENTSNSFLEKDLHPFLVYFAFNHLNCFCKTIRHNGSTKKEFGEWVHPDIVGCVYPIDEWNDEVFELCSIIGNTSVNLISFELKRSLSFANLRESFFQTVSNSTWANESYLVAANISKDEEFINELTRLSSSFGIGIIELDIEEPNSSFIKLPAKYKNELDWETINKLSKMNSDFRDYITRIQKDIKSKEIRKESFDKIFENEELLNSIK